MNKRTDEKKPSACYCLNLRRAAHAITEHYNNVMAPSGIILSQYSLLKHIKILEPVNVSDLAQAMRLDRTTLVRNLKVLEDKGLIEDISTRGTRSRSLQLTVKGVEILKESSALWEKAQSDLKEYLGDENLKALTSLLSKIENMQPK